MTGIVHYRILSCSAVVNTNRSLASSNRYFVRSKLNTTEWMRNTMSMQNKVTKSKILRFHTAKAWY